MGLLAAEWDLGTGLPVAPPAEVAVGDRCYTMESTGAGRILLEGSITGRGESAGTAVPHWVATFFTGPGTPGAPVLNQFGEVLGVIGAATVSSPLSQRLLLRMQADLKGSRVVPLGAFSALAGAAPTPLAELRARGAVVPLVTGERHVVSGGFGQGVVKQPFVQVADQREDFSRSEKSFVVWVSWSPVERLKGMITLRLYDDENKRVVDATPVKKDLRKGELVLTSWTVPVPQTPGVYRTDVFLDQNIMWRGYVRITP